MGSGFLGRLNYKGSQDQTSKNSLRALPAPEFGRMSALDHPVQDVGQCKNNAI